MEGPFDTILTINRVKDLQYKDTERIGFYDINKIIVDPDRLNMKIICGFPLSIDITLFEDYEISLFSRVGCAMHTMCYLATWRENRKKFIAYSLQQA